MLVLVLGGLVVTHHGTYFLLEDRNPREFCLMLLDLPFNLSRVLFVLSDLLIQLGYLALHYWIGFFSGHLLPFRLVGQLSLALLDLGLQGMDLIGLCHDLRVTRSVPLAQLVHFALELCLFRFEASCFWRVLCVEIHDRWAVAKSGFQATLLLFSLVNRFLIVMEFEL